MAIDTRHLQALVEPVVEAIGCELWGVEFGSGSGHDLLRVYIDRAGGVSLDDCERVSRQLGAVLDVEDPIGGPYTLEVSSPGMDRPLLEASHFARNVGQPITVKTREKVGGRRNFKGALSAFDEDRLVIECEGGPVTIPYREVEHARLVPDYSEDL